MNITKDELKQKVLKRIEGWDNKVSGDSYFDDKDIRNSYDARERLHKNPEIADQHGCPAVVISQYTGLGLSRSLCILSGNIYTPVCNGLTTNKGGLVHEIDEKWDTIWKEIKGVE